MTRESFQNVAYTFSFCPLSTMLIHLHLLLVLTITLPVSGHCALRSLFLQFPKGDMRGALLLSNLQEWSLFPACRLAHSFPLPLCTTSFKATLKRVHRQLHSKEIQSVRTI